MDITVSAAPQTRNISEKLYGIFLEDINYGGDGGLYAELVPNRAFEFEGPNGQDNRLMRWQALGGAKLEIAAENPRGDKNPHYMRIIPAQGECGARSEGYLGEGFYAERHETYRPRDKAAGAQYRIQPRQAPCCRRRPAAYRECGSTARLAALP